MPKSIIIEPERVFASQSSQFADIPVNAYAKTIEEELANYSAQDFLNIWQDMCAIREFETSLNEIKTKGAYKNVTYNHAGPAHLSIGQEAAAVGMAFGLGPEDHIFGSHRSHGEILAKGFSAIRKLSDDQLLTIMRTYRDGALLRPVEKGYRGNVQGLAVRFFVYGAYSEIFARETGFNRGLGGSMHAFFAPFGIYPNNAIVGGSGSIAPGAALFKRVNRKPGIVVANIGDASFGCGPVWEGITLSAMAQYRSLWDESLGGGLPIIFNCMNNFYGMGGQTARRDDGDRRDRPHRRRRQSRADARRARQRLRSAARHRRLPPQEATAAGGPRARCCWTPSRTASAGIRRPTRRATGRRRRSSAGSRPIRSARSAPSCSESGAVTEDALDSARVWIEAALFDMLQLAVDLEASPRVSAGSELVGRGDVHEPSRREVRRPRARVHRRASKRTRACSRFAARSARPPTAASPCRR